MPVKTTRIFIAMVLLMYAADSATDSLHNPVLQKALLDMARKIEEATEGQ